MSSSIPYQFAKNFLKKDCFLKQKVNIIVFMDH